MANWVKAFAAKHDHLSWISSTHMMEGENRCSWLVLAFMCAFQTNKQTVELNQNEVNCSMRQYDLEERILDRPRSVLILHLFLAVGTRSSHCASFPCKARWSSCPL